MVIYIFKMQTALKAYLLMLTTGNIAQYFPLGMDNASEIENIFFEGKKFIKGFLVCLFKNFLFKLVYFFSNVVNDRQVVVNQRIYNLMHQKFRVSLYERAVLFTPLHNRLYASEMAFVKCDEIILSKKYI